MEGLLLKYQIKKIDGTPVNPKAKYFVLRYDENMEDKKFLHASRKALLEFCDQMMLVNRKLSGELRSALIKEMIKANKTHKNI